ncbi:hypothetical protein CF645_37955 [Burkholderia pseudomallei]|nr:hypothetical protein CF645_37955 [Burkholderia pseudomallei]
MRPFLFVFSIRTVDSFANFDISRASARRLAAFLPQSLHSLRAQRMQGLRQKCGEASSGRARNIEIGERIHRAN